MKMFKIVAACCFALSTLLNMANADEIQLGVPAYGGSGCPAGTAYVSMDSADGALSLRFDHYAAEVKNGSKMARVSCNFAIPLHVPQGYSVSVIGINYNGYLSLPKKAQARFSAEYFFAGSRGPKFDKIFQGPIDDSFAIENDILVESQVSSNCGEDTILRINSSILVQTAKKRDHAIAVIDSADINHAIIYKLQTKRCE